jgi:DNA-binding CsgD family transcriptional regulator
VDFVLLAAAEEGPRPFPEPVVAALRRVVACETVAYREWGEHGIRDRSFAPEGLDERRAIWDEYPRLRCEDPHPSEVTSGASAVASARRRTGEPLVLSEAVSRRWFRSAGLYFELMRPFGIRDVLKLFLPGYGGGAVESALVFDTSARGFTDGDRTTLTLLAPVLAQLQRNAYLRGKLEESGRRLRRLTPRELTVLAHAAAGETTAQIAGALFIGPSTVRKHLEHVYEKLEVPNRAAATAVYRQTGSADPAGRTTRPRGRALPR